MHEQVEDPVIVTMGDHHHLDQMSSLPWRSLPVCHASRTNSSFHGSAILAGPGPLSSSIHQSGNDRNGAAGVWYDPDPPYDPLHGRDIDQNDAGDDDSTISRNSRLGQ